MYTCLPRHSLRDADGYALVCIRRDDSEPIRLWRNAQQEVLRQNKVLSVSDQQRYFYESILPSFSQPHPSQILFSFSLNDQLIGYGGLTHIDWNASHAEVSFLLNPVRTQDTTAYARDHHHFLDLLCAVAFTDLHLHRLFTETFSFRHEHIRSLERFGFVQEGILREHVHKQDRWIDSIMHGLLAAEWVHE